MDNTKPSGGYNNMQKTMLELVVSTSEGMIYVEGPEYTNEKGEAVRDYISLSPDQVDTLVAWLQEAKAELTEE
jgi:hypothetical protein